MYKPSFSNVFPFFRNAIVAIADAHNFGNMKYEPYSFQNDPKSFAASLGASRDALVRHYVHYKTIPLHDGESGLPHLHHMACRIHMIMTTFYRDVLARDHRYFNRKKKYVRTQVHSVFNEIATDDETEKCVMLPVNITDQITPELIISCMKFDKWLNKNMASTITPEIGEALLHSGVMNIAEIDIPAMYSKKLTDSEVMTSLFESIHLIDVMWWGIAAMMNTPADGDPILGNDEVIVTPESKTAKFQHMMKHLKYTEDE